MQIIVPMAGLGKRFSDAGYTQPKPLIPVCGEPMIARVVNDLPPAKRVVFIVHPEHVANHAIDRELLARFPHGQVVVTPGLTEGQACSVRLGTDHLDQDDEVIVAACDNSPPYDREKFARATAERGVDCLIWTYRGENRVVQNPHWYGWVRADESGEVLDVSVKKPISDTPLEDPVISGTFWFRNPRLLAESIDRLVAANERVNNEFYLDSAPNVLRRMNRRSKLFEVERYVGWGTPAEYAIYRDTRSTRGVARAA